MDANCCSEVSSTESHVGIIAYPMIFRRRDLYNITVFMYYSSIFLCIVRISRQNLPHTPPKTESPITGPRVAQSDELGLQELH